MAVDGLASQGPQMADLLADLLQNATFPEDRVEAKREEYLGELQLSVAQPGFHRSRLSSRVLFGEHVYGSTIEPDDVSSFICDQLVAFYESFFGPNRAQLVVVGDITDELDTPNRGWRKAGDNVYLIQGSMTLRDLNRDLGWNLPEDDAATLAGLLMHESRTLPQAGQKFRFYGQTFEIVRRKGNQITLIRAGDAAGREEATD
jgi:hypothetical protein